LSQPGYSLRGDVLLWTLVAALLLLSALHPAGIPMYPRLVDWPTVATLAGMLLLTAGIETSGFLQRLARNIIGLVRDERALALVLVGGSALLSAVLTNDIALFIVVPLTLSLGRFAELPLTRLVTFEALAVNTGSMLTPIGNPQNIFLWQSSGARFLDFIAVMAVPTLIAAICLLGFTLWGFRPQPVRLQADGTNITVHWTLFALSAALFVPFVVCADFHYVLPALAAVAGLFLLCFRGVLLRLDWPLLLVFTLMFIDLRLMAGLPWVAGMLAKADLGHASSLYLTGVGLSQGISNVPATILLSSYSGDWRTLAWATDMGGFGFILGSLANLIALRLAGRHGSLGGFHAWSLPFLFVAGSLTGLWLLVK
jgi:Na+/H+ antiporter NhaD/arsenite permease-like protein